MVMSYPEVIRNNMGERLAETNTPYLCPFLPLHDKKRIGKRLAEELKAWNLPAHEVKAAAAAAWDEEEAYKQKIYDITKKILDNLEKTGQRAIVLCGRPYHIDPEINHGIPELINSLGLPSSLKTASLPWASSRATCASSTNGPTIRASTGLPSTSHSIRTWNWSNSIPSAAASTPSSPTRSRTSWPTATRSIRCSRLTKAPTSVPSASACARCSSS